MTLVDFSKVTEQLEQPPAKRHRILILVIDGGYHWAVAREVSGGGFMQSTRFADFASAKADLDHCRSQPKFPLSFLP